MVNAARHRARAFKMMIATAGAHSWLEDDQQRD
jgi:hypothetical protein